MTTNSKPKEFFAQFEKLILTLVDQGMGEIALTLKSQPIKSGRRQIKVETPNLGYGVGGNFFCSTSLRSYLTQLPDSTDREAVGILRESLLKIINEGGFGSVLLNFKREKRTEETIIFCKTTISRRHVISSI